jgi:holliday junction resolvase YEN1
VQAVFVFDGPHKPKIKRNKRSGRGPSVATAQAKKLIRLFGFPIHDAPGEAEAECALLQRHGVVDAVLSEDVDTVMFGCTKSLRNWSAENGKSSPTPTHVDVYEAKEGDAKMLDREGMILVALMSGGDYSPEGIPGCGIKLACEAARAGYGKSLCRLKASDKTGLQEWRDMLSHDLETNEHQHFQRKHKALKIPDDWPDLEILRYYTHPVVSPISVTDTIRSKLDNLETIKLEHLREYTREEFGWDFRIGALKFIKVLATSQLSTKLLRNEGAELVKRISSRREHFSADAEPELRLSYVPSEVVLIDLSQEVEENIPHTRDALAVNAEDDEVAPDVEDGPSSQPRVFDPTKPEAVWFSEEFATRTIASIVTAWKEAETEKANKKASKALAPKKKRGPVKKSLKDSGMAQGALDAHFRVTKTPASSKAPEKEPVEAVLKPATAPPTPPSSFTQQAAPAQMRQPSKPPTTPTKAKDHKSLPGPAGSPITPPRAQPATTRPEAIIISSSPLCAASPPASSFEPGTHPSRGAEVFDDVWSSPPKTTASQVRVKERSKTKSTTTKPLNLPGSPSKLKQTSITMFATRSTNPRSSQPAQSQPDSSQPRSSQPVPGQSAPNQARQVSSAASENSELEESYMDDSSMELPSLSSLLSRSSASPKSPGKRLKSPGGPSRNESPARASKSKKTLLVPDTDGYIRVMRVDTSKRDQLEASETRRLERQGVRQRPMRQSDIAFIDLTEE